MSFSGLLSNWLEQNNNTTNIDENQIRQKLGYSQNQWNSLTTQERETKINQFNGDSSIKKENSPLVNNNNSNNSNNSSLEQKSNNASTDQPQQATNVGPQFEFDRYLLSWMRSTNTSFLISSYKTHKVFSIGFIRDKSDNKDKLSLWITNFNRPMGIHADKKTAWISSSGNLWRFENSGKYIDDNPENKLGEFDANYIPRMAYFSNDIDAHEKLQK